MAKHKRKIAQYDLNNNLIKIWNSGIDVEKEMNWFSTKIIACCRNKQKTAYGYMWKYI